MLVHIAFTLYHLLTRSAAQNAGIAPKDCLAPLVKLLLHASDEAATMAAEALIVLEGIGAGHCDAILVAGALPQLAACLLSDSTAAQQNAALLLKTMASSSSACCVAIAAASILPVLAQLLHRKLAGTKTDLFDNAAALLYALTCGNVAAHQGAVLASGCLSPLAAMLPRIADSLLSDPLPMLVLFNLAQSSDAGRAGAVAAGCLPPVLALLQHNDPNIQHCASCFIANLADGSGAQRDAIVAAGCVPPLVALLSQPPLKADPQFDHLDVAQQALAALCKLATGSDARRRAIAATRCLPRLLDVLGHASLKMALFAACALAELASAGNSACGDGAVPAGTVPRLVSLLWGESYKVCSSAITGLHSLSAGNAAHCDAMLACAGCLPALVAHLFHASPSIVAQAAQALGNLAAGSKARRRSVLATGCLPAAAGAAGARHAHAGGQP